MAVLLPTYKLSNALQVLSTAQSTFAANVSVTGYTFSTNFSGNGASLTNLDAGALATGTVNTARLGSGTANTTTFLRGDNTWVTSSSSVAWGAITGTLSSQTDLNTALNGKEPSITAGTSAQYWRGDKTWQTLNSAAVGLGSVENTALSTWAGSANLVTVGTITTGTWTGTAIAANRGGTGLTTYAIGDLVQASTASTLAALAAVATGNVLISGGVGTISSWGKVGLTTHVSGTLGVGNGGTGLAAVGTSNQILSSNTAGTGNEYRTISGTNGISTSFGTGTITVTSNATTANTNSTIALRDGTGRLTATQFIAGGDPTTALEVATKQYVDSLAQGLDVKASVIASTTVAGGNITTIAGGAPNVLDGITLAANDRVLVKNQSTASQNGIYTVTTLGTGANGTWTRATDMDAWTEVPGAFCFVERGTTLADTGWVSTADQGGTLNTTNITWAQFSGAGAYTGSTGIVLSGNDFQLTSTALSLHNLATTGLIARTGAGTVTTRTLTAPAAGMTVTNGDGVAGNPTLVLANDLSAVEGLATNGYAVRTGTDTWATRTFLVSGSGLSITNADGTSTNTTITSNAVAAATISTLVFRDANADFSANNITAALIGNASTATTLVTTRSIAISGPITGTATNFNGSANITIPVTALDVGHANVTGTLTAGRGGTGNATYAIGDLLQASGATALTRLAAVATGNVLISGGVTTASTWGKVGLGTHVSGTLVVGNGGTGVTSSTGSGTNFVLSTAPTFVTNITVPTIILGSGTTTSDIITSGAMFVQRTGALTTAATTLVDLDTFLTATYRSARYVVQIHDTVSGATQISDILVGRNNANDVMISESGIAYTGGAQLATFSVDYNGTTAVRLRITPASASSTQFKFTATIFNN